MTALARVVLIEDEHLVRRKLALGLGELGFEMFEASDAFACRVVMKRENPDVALVDLGLPGLSGLALARELRERSDLAIIVVTHQSEPETLIQALDIGCDDFVIKPVHVGELAARIRSVLRRRAFARGRRHDLGPWRVDLDSRTVSSKEAAASLTRGEFLILESLINANGKILSREELMRVVSRNPGEADARTVDALVSRLRRKLSVSATPADLIVTAPGYGYRLGVAVEPVRDEVEP